MKSPSQCCKPFENWTINNWDIPKSGAKLPTCWKTHRRPSQVILLHRRSFRTSHRRCAASQRVAGPICVCTVKDMKIMVFWRLRYNSAIWAFLPIEGPVPRTDENQWIQPPTYKDWSAGNAGLKVPTNRNWCRPGGRQDLLFHNWSAGELAFLVKKVQYNIPKN